MARLGAMEEQAPRPAEVEERLHSGAEPRVCSALSVPVRGAAGTVLMRLHKLQLWVLTN